MIIKSKKSEIKKSCLQLFEFLNFKNRINKVKKVIIKPNLVSTQSYTLGSITDPIIVDELIKYLISFYDNEIVIVESESVWRTGKSRGIGGLKLSIKNSGIESIVKKNKNVRVLNITRAKKLDAGIVMERIRKRFGKKSMNIFPEFLNIVPKEFDLDYTDAIFISLSKLKSHCFPDTKITNCMKNQYGMISYPNKMIYHDRLSEAILYVNMISQSFFDCYYITEALRYTMEGSGPIKGNTLKGLGFAIAGQNPVEVDAIASTLMEVDPSKLDYLQLARGVLGQYDPSMLAKIPKSFKYPFKLHPDINKLVRVVD